MPAIASAAAVRHVFRARFLRLRRRTTDGRTNERTEGRNLYLIKDAHSLYFICLLILPSFE